MGGEKPKHAKGSQARSSGGVDYCLFFVPLQVAVFPADLIVQRAIIDAINYAWTVQIERRSLLHGVPFTQRNVADPIEASRAIFKNDVIT